MEGFIAFLFLATFLGLGIYALTTLFGRLRAIEELLREIRDTLKNR